MIVNKANIAAIFATLVAVWDGLVASVKPDWQSWATRLPSTSGSNIYVWVDLMVQIRKWVGARQYGNMKAHKSTVVNDDFEGTFDIDRNDIEDDNIGILPSKTRNLYNRAIYFPQHLLEHLQLLAYDHVCHDGQYMIDSDHPTPKDAASTFSNVISGVSGTVNPVLGEDGLQGALSMFRGFQDAGGDPMDLTPYQLVVGPSNEWVAKKLLENENNAVGETNVMRNALPGYRVNPEFIGSYAKYWQVMAKPSGTDLTPYAYQDRKVPDLTCTALSGSNEFGIEGQDERQFETRKIGIGTHFRGAATFTLPQLVVGSTGAEA